MDERRLGATGLHVSEIGLGTMTWGDRTDEDAARELLRDFLDAGGTLVDSAASYGSTDAESILGSLLATDVPRADLVLCVQSGLRRAGSVAGTGSAVVPDASRRHLLDGLDASLRRLGTDHVDLFLVQAPDPRTPLAETASALETAISSGRARYVGVGDHPAWRTAALATRLAAGGSCGLAAAGLEYSLLERGLEAEVAPAATELGVGLLAWSPLGRGVLTGKYRKGTPADSRAASDRWAPYVEQYLDAGAGAVVSAVSTAADGLGRSPLEVALAWTLARGVSSAVVGPRTPAHLRAATAAADLELPREVMAALDDVSAPGRTYPAWRG
ncbi:oxidoreductase [Paraoerskovia sediminicola]|uniref:Oxidoreductase n=1 Tax=Paraoerskovia sediminicola TaxID=1138587 RepID=A0ABN6XFJ2_9CELL|nr:aldo/keto reductase [Paraoerskovia sediminicola]BDZ43693.1 oxidoreductase [Paraoerskovia sediminicola]